MPKNLSFNADINLTGDITDVGDITASSFIGTVAPATETTLTATSNTAFLTAASHTLANGSVQGTRKLIVNDQGRTLPPSITAVGGKIPGKIDVLPFGTVFTPSQINAFAYDPVNNQVYVGGKIISLYTLADVLDPENAGAATDAFGIVRIDVATNTLAPLIDAGGINGVKASSINSTEVHDLLYYDSNIYISGFFNTLGDGTGTGFLAKYDIATNAFSNPTGTAPTSHVFGLTRVGTNVYFGGQFTNGSYRNIGVWNTTTDAITHITDTASNRGVSQKVQTLTTLGTKVYMGTGNGADTDPTPSGSTSALCVYDTVADLFSTVTNATVSAKGTIENIKGHDGKVYIASQQNDPINNLPSGQADYLAVYEEATNTFSKLAGSYDGVNSIPRHLEVLDNKLYIVGGFTQLNGTSPTPNFSVGRYAVYDITAGDFDTSDDIIVPAYDNTTYSVSAAGSVLYVGGQFKSVAGDTTIVATSILDPGSVTTESTINGSFRKSDGTTPSSQTLSNLGGTLDIMWDGTYWTVV